MVKPKELYNFILHLSKREKIIFYSATAIVSLVLLDRLIIYPIHAKISALSREINEKAIEIKKDLHILSQKARVSAQITQYSGMLESTKSQEEEMTVILQEIEALAEKASVYLIDIKPSTTKTADSAAKYFINLSCEAQMEQVINFMYSLENSNRFLTIEKYQLSPKSKESSVIRCNMVVSRMSIP